MSDANGYFALAGVVLVIVPQMLLEKYKKHLERCAVAQAYIGEISSILDMTQRRNYVASFTQAHNIAASGTLVPKGVFDIGLSKEHKDPVFENYIKKLGLLHGALPRDLARFYAQLQGIRTDIIRLADGSAFQTAADQDRILAEDLKIWGETETLGRDVVLALQRQAVAHFIPSRYWFYLAGLVSAGYLLGNALAL